MPLFFRRAFLAATLVSVVLASLAQGQDVAPATVNAQSPIPLPENGATEEQIEQNDDDATPQNAALPARKKSPEERRQQMEERLRALMINLGLTATATQDAIITYLAEDEMGHASVRDAEKRLLTGLRRDAPPERMRDLVGDYRTALESDKTRRTAAQRKLDARIGYSFDPKLEAMLWLMGVLGDGQTKISTGALAAKANPQSGTQIAASPPIYGPPVSPNFGARGEIVGTVTAKGVGDKGEHWLEIRDDSGALDRYAPLWRDDLGALDPDVDGVLAKTPLSARVRVQWVWQERRRALKLQPENAALATIP